MPAPIQPPAAARATTPTSNDTAMVARRTGSAHAANRWWKAISLAGVVSRASSRMARPRTRPKSVPSPSASSGLAVSAASTMKR